MPNTDPPRCNSTDTETGEPCQNPAGYGTDADIGPCHLHPSEGRPSKFNADRAQDAIAAARDAKSLSGCGRAAGVARGTLVNWLERNPKYRTEDGTYAEFFPAFMRARSEAERLLTRAPLTRPDEVDGSHARFLLKTSFGYQETDRLEIDAVTEDDKEELAELEAMAEDLF